MDVRRIAVICPFVGGLHSTCKVAELSPHIDLGIRVIPSAIRVGLLLSFFSCNESEKFVKGRRRGE